ncbi:MAG: metalloprotease PmbA [Pseudomonadota bacterium]
MANPPIPADDSSIVAERPRLESLVQQILDEARTQGASAAEVGVSAERGLSLSVRMGEVETVEFTRSGGFGITVYAGRRKGHASTSDTRPQAIREAVAAALDIARHTSEDPCAGLADPAQLARDLPDLDLHHAWPLTPDAAIALALECEDAGRAVDARIVNSEGAGVNTHEVYRVYANSNGFFAGYPSTRHSLSCALIAREGEDMQRDYWYDAARDAAVLAPAAQIGRLAGERAVRRLGAQAIATGKMPVLFVPELAPSLIGHFLSAIAGGALYRRSSFLLDRLGQQVFPDWLQIEERPRLRGELGSASFDSDGLPTCDKHFVRDGVLASYALGLYSARRLGMTPTANGGGTHNVFVGGTGESFAALLEKMGSGIVVTELMGNGVNPVTGDYSRGAAGFRVEEGRIVHPVSGITIAGSLPEMYRHIVAVGNDADRRGHVHCGSVLLEAMTVAAEG